MALATLQMAYDTARGYLHDTQVPGGETATNAALATHFGEAWRRMWRALAQNSKRAQKFVYINFPADTTVLIPSTYNMTDFAEPELIEERLATASLTIVSSDTSTPIRLTITSHGLGANGVIGGPAMVSGIANTTAPWGQWFYTIVDSNTISLNGSVSDGIIGGSGGIFSLSSTNRWTEVLPADLAGQCIDGNIQQVLGCYLWQNEQLIFRGSNNVQQLRITYWSSGSPPTLVNANLGIDDCIDFVACVTAANFANAQGWTVMADRLNTKAFGSSEQPDEPGGLLLEFLNLQVKTQQRGPQRRRGPFRTIRHRWGTSGVYGQ